MIKKEKDIEYIFTNINTEETVIHKGSYRSFCIQKGLDYRAFSMMVNGNVKISQGWFLGKEKPVYKKASGGKPELTEEHKNKIALSQKKEGFDGHKIINWKTQEKFIIFNLKDFARKNDLDYGTLNLVVKNKSPSVKDFILDKEEYNKSIIDNKGKKYISIFEAAILCDSFPWKILNICNGLQKESNGKSFKFI